MEKKHGKTDSWGKRKIKILGEPSIAPDFIPESTLRRDGQAKWTGGPTESRTQRLELVTLKWMEIAAWGSRHEMALQISSGTLYWGLWRALHLC